jgi:RimJ/RimL family protein N-acetyltransferase
VTVPSTDSDVALRPWATGDLPLLERLLGDPAMTVHLGGPESPAKLRRRNQSYAAVNPAEGQMFVILAGDEPAGSVGYWLLDWQGVTVWETGCSVLPEFQGRGIGRRGLELAAECARTAAPHRPIHAYPSVENAASNAMCRSAGFTLLGEADFEYPAGHPMRVNDWMLPARWTPANDAAGEAVSTPG